MINKERHYEMAKFSFCHPYYEINLEHAMALALQIHRRDNPEAPVDITVATAIKTLEAHLKASTFNWITGRVCLELLKAYQEALPILMIGKILGLNIDGSWLPTFDPQGNFTAEDLCKIEEIRLKHCHP